jgi:cytochrome c
MRFHSVLASTSALLLFASVAVCEAAPAPSPAAIGKQQFIRCAACHAMTAKGPAKIGPHLQGLVGRKAGTVAGFRYSPAMARANLVWTEDALDRWLQRPTALVPGTSMAFAGMADAAQRKALVAYLKKPGR